MYSIRAMTAAMDTDVIAIRLWFYLGSCVDLLVTILTIGVLTPFYDYY